MKCCQPLCGCILKIGRPAKDLLEEGIIDLSNELVGGLPAKTHTHIPDPVPHLPYPEGNGMDERCEAPQGLIPSASSLYNATTEGPTK